MYNQLFGVFLGEEKLRGLARGVVVGVDEPRGVVGAELAGPVVDPLSVPPPAAPPDDDNDELEDFPAAD